MPELNRVRLGHIEYNNGRSIITDEMLDFHHESSLLRMDNGGGKSVLTQLLLAPYLSARSRSFPKRHFSDYFKSPKPSFILQEWKLDDDAGYFTIGMIVRKNQSVQNQSKGHSDEKDNKEDRRLDLYTFVSEYQNLDAPNSLDAIQVLSVEQGSKSYISFQQTRKSLEDLARKYPASFRFYNLNNTSHRQAYGQRLLEFGLEPAEWEQMREFNQDESGLSNFTERNDTEEKLIERVFLPAIERKLNQAGKANHMQAFRETLKSYIEMQLENEDIFEKKKQHETFLQHLHELSDPAQDLEAHSLLRLSILQSLSSFITGIEKALPKLDEQIEEQKTLQSLAKEEADSIQIEIHSQNFHKLSDQLEILVSDIQSLDNFKADKAKLLQEATALLHAYELAFIWNGIIQEQAKIKGLHARMESMQKSEEQILQEIGAHATILARILKARIADAENKIATLSQNTEAANERIEELQEEETFLNKKHSVLLRKQGSLHQIINSYRSQEESFLSSNNLVLNHTLSFYEDDDLFLDLIAELEKQKEEKENNVLRQEKELSKTEEMITEVQQQLVSVASLLANANNRQQILQKREEKEQKIWHRKQKLAHDLQISQDSILDDEHLLKRLDEKISTLSREVFHSHEMILEQNRSIENMETGCVLDLGDAMKSIMQDLGIEIQSGAEYLKSRRMSASYRKKLLETHPFLPYGLVIPSVSLHPLIDTLNEKKIYTSSLLTLIDEASLMKSTQEIPELDGITFYHRFNQALIEPEELEKMLLAARKRLQQEEAYVNGLQKQQQRWQEAVGWTQSHPLDEKTRSLHQEETEKAKKDVHDAVARQRELQLNKKGLEKKKKEQEKELSRLRSLHRKATGVYEGFVALFDDYQTSKEAWNDLLENEADCEKIQKEISEGKAETDSLRNQITEWKLLSNNLVHQKETSHSEYQIYQAYVPDDSTLLQDLEIQEEEYLSHKAVFDGLCRKLQNSQIGELKKEIADLQKKIAEDQNYFEELLKKYQMMNNSWKSHHPSQTQILAQRSRIETLRSEVDQLKDDIYQKELKKERLITRKETLVQQIAEIRPGALPLDKNQTRTIDLTDEKKRALDLADEAADQIDLLVQKRKHFEDTHLQARSQFRQQVDEPVEAPAMNSLEKLDEKELASQLEELLHALDRSLTIIHKLQTSSGKRLNEIIDYARDLKDHVLEDAGKALRETLDQPSLFKEQIEAKIQLLETMLEKIETDLQSVKKAREETIGMLHDFLHRVQNQFARIDRNTTIHLQGRPRKMLQITLADWQSNDALYLQRIASWLDDLIEQAGNHPEKLIEILAKNVSLPALYRSVITLSSVSVKIYKIEENRESLISWNQAGITSGAESFLCAFTVVSAVLAYQRSEEATPLANRKKSSVMIMDNPFAKAHSQHIISPLMSMCEAMSIQLIAFSAVENAAILSGFHTIYSLRMIPRNDGKDHLLIESVKSDARSFESLGLHISILSEDEEE